MIVATLFRKILPFATLLHNFMNFKGWKIRFNAGQHVNCQFYEVSLLERET